MPRGKESGARGGAVSSDVLVPESEFIEGDLVFNGNVESLGYLWVKGDIKISGDIYSKCCVIAGGILECSNIYIEVGDVGARRISVSGDLIAPTGYVHAVELLSVAGNLISEVVCALDIRVSGKLDSLRISSEDLGRYIKGYLIEGQKERFVDESKRIIKKARGDEQE